jgi:hypothetical protein
MDNLILEIFSNQSFKDKAFINIVMDLNIKVLSKMDLRMEKVNTQISMEEFFKELGKWEKE